MVLKLLLGHKQRYHLANDTLKYCAVQTFQQIPMVVADEMIRLSVVECPVAGKWDWVKMKEGVGGGDNIVQTNGTTSMAGWKQLTQLSVQVEGGETVVMEGNIVAPGVGGDDQATFGQRCHMEYGMMSSCQGPEQCVEFDMEV